MNTPHSQVYTVNDLVSTRKTLLAPLAIGAALMLASFGASPTGASTLAPAVDIGGSGSVVAVTDTPTQNELSILLTESKEPAATTAVTPVPAVHGPSAF